ncbi:MULTISPECIES: hypothetical protein [unclassified Mesorhizobium]|uniref:hypothetical protein n=1 Tax=unclassified Mesorhizobium TaxID=325217 RepID=UPI001FEF6F2E|nr:MULTISPECIES: hypothetical protein [unclassified Mesorhizobium]
MPETERQYTERLLREMLAEATAAEEARADEARAAKAKADRAKAAKTEAALARAAKPPLPRLVQPALRSVPEPALFGSPEAALPSVANLALPGMGEPSTPSALRLALVGAPKAALRGVSRLASGSAKLISSSASKAASRKAAKSASRNMAKPAPTGETKPVSIRTVEPALRDVSKPAFPEVARPAPPAFAKPSLPKAPHAELNEAIAASRDSLLDGLFPDVDWPQPPRAQFPKVNKKDDRRSDIVFAALGITLGLICALFPWYIFFNQDQFGVQAIKFGGSGTNAGRVSGGSQMENSGQPLTANDVPDVDLFATGTLQDPDDKTQPAGVDEQPFPADPKFRMVHVANGRAMIEDDAGLWIVQRGSKLPDSSVVSSIEQRGGKWVMVTSTDQVIELSK